MRGLVSLLNVISFFLGPGYIIGGGRSKNLARVGFGVILFASSIVDFGLPEPYETVLQLLAASGGAVIRIPGE